MDSDSPPNNKRFQFSMTDMLFVVFVAGGVMAAAASAGPTNFALIGGFGIVALSAGIIASNRAQRDHRPPAKQLAVLAAVAAACLIVIASGIAYSDNRTIFALLPAFLVFGSVAIFLSKKRFSFLAVTTISLLSGVLASLVIVQCFSQFFLRTRICSNDTAAAASCKAFAEAEDIYRRMDHNKDGVLEYAQSLSGNNSLYETTGLQADVGLIDRTFSVAEFPGNGGPKAGYWFKVLKAQSKNAPGGAMSYIDGNGRMTKGYALVAFPAQYKGTGSNTFIISNSGTIYQSDLGPKTQSIAEKMTEFDPDTSVWVVSE